MKKLKLMMLVVFMCVVGAMGFSGGDGTEASPYLISNVADLKALSALVMNDTGSYSYEYDNRGSATRGKHFKMTKNINMAGVTDFIPIGGWSSASTNSSAKFFAGVFDGGGYEVQNLVIERTADENGDNADYIGLFGYVKARGVAVTIKNIGVTGNSSFKGDTNVGGLIGWAYTSSSIYSRKLLFDRGCYF